MRKYVYKIITVVLAVAFLIFLIVASIPKNTSKTGNVITVYSWEDYIDEELLTEFEAYYKEEYGEEITVNYFTFATNEEMFNELSKNPNGCDLMCPSEYMIMKLIEKKLIKSFDIPSIYKENVSPFINDKFNELGLNAENGKTFACGYMWGTMGLLYNADIVDIEDFTYWEGLLNEKYKGKITIKDSVRDTYIMALAILYKDELLSANPNYEEIFNRVDDETIFNIENILKDLKNNLYGFEVDSGKTDILSGKISVNFAWSGDAVYSMDEGDEAGVNLSYFVPLEGSNIWFDGWVMPNNADEKRASAFIDFLSIPQNAAKNMDYIGYTSCISGNEKDNTVFNQAVDWYGITKDDYDLLSANEQEDYSYVDLSYFFDGNENGDYVIYYLSEESGRQLYAQYADLETISRCAIMKDFDDESLGKINEMWSSVKLVTLPTYAIILIIVVVVLLITALILYMFREKIFISKGGKIGSVKQKSKYEIISKEPI